jgi:hypothetical protein
MPVIYSDITIQPEVDGTITISLVPPTSISQWNLEWRNTNRFGGVSGLIVTSCASGYGNGVSGMTVLDSGLGIVNTKIRSSQTSGVQGAQVYTFRRLGSGVAQMLSEGYLNITW